MGIVNIKYAVLLELDDSVRSVINLSLLIALLLGPCVFTTTMWSAYKAVLWYKNAKTYGNFYIKSVVALADVLTLICWLLFVVFQYQIQHGGHVPVLDAMYRDYDRESLCWSGVRVDECDYNSIECNYYTAHRNCVYHHISGTGYDIVKKCIACRIEVRHDEPTVFVKNQLSLVILALTLAAVHGWNMYVRQKEMRNRPTIIPNKDIETPPNEDYDTADEDELESSLRMLEVLSVGRESSEEKVLPRVLAFDFSNIYDTPQSVYRIPPKPKKSLIQGLIPPPPPMPI